MSSLTSKGQSDESQPSNLEVSSASAMMKEFRLSYETQNACHYPSVVSTFPHQFVRVVQPNLQSSHVFLFLTIESLA